MKDKYTFSTTDNSSLNVVILCQDLHLKIHFEPYFFAPFFHSALYTIIYRYNNYISLSTYRTFHYNI